MTWRRFEGQSESSRLEVGTVIQGDARAELNGIVAESHVDKAYRPVVVAVIRRSDGRALLLCSAKNRDEWMFLQGGIDEEEDILDALYRETQEEVGSNGGAGYLSGPATFLGIADLDAPAGRVDKRGFAAGKRYIFVGVGFVTDEYLRFEFNPEEICVAGWALPGDEFDAFTARTREEKRDMMRWALQNSEYVPPAE